MWLSPYLGYPLITRIHCIGPAGLGERAICNLSHPVVVVQIQSYKPIGPPMASLELLWLGLQHAYWLTALCSFGPYPLPTGSRRLPPPHSLAYGFPPPICPRRNILLPIIAPHPPILFLHLPVVCRNLLSSRMPS
ncbi:hypothetical protein VNO77_22625 [Canavalia gladiata]|uniref:Uncharacterized protein n=1 Tax=Canavalia gladiata TaxID=3824 RepID=A0AAN9L3V5_CANGL